MHCQGTQLGWCLASACGNADTTCWVGPAHGQWQHLVSNWSKQAFPSNVWNVIVSGSPVITTSIAAAGTLQVLEGSVEIGSSGMLTLG